MINNNISASMTNYHNKHNEPQQGHNQGHLSPISPWSKLPPNSRWGAVGAENEAL